MDFYGPIVVTRRMKALADIREEIERVEYLLMATELDDPELPALRQQHSALLDRELDLMGVA